MPHSLSAGRHLGCILVLAFVTDAAVNVAVQNSLRTAISFMKEAIFKECTLFYYDLSM